MPVGIRPSFGARLRGLRAARGMSQGELAHAVGRHQTAIGPYERDEYAPPREIVERLAAALDSSAEYLMFGRHPRRSLLMVTGRMTSGGLVETEVAATAVGIAEDQLTAVLVDDDSMVPLYRRDQLLLVRTRESVPAAVLGREVVARLADGRLLVRRLMPSARADRFDLAALNAPVLREAEVISARLVAGVLWPDSLHRPEHEPGS